MDNQIRKLAERAGYHSGEPTAEAFNEFNIDKFANSILDQVLTICDEVSEPVDEDDPMVPGAQVCAEMIRENFGIKK
jgi:hypothetical protein